jgi:hypothetical protein
LPSSLTAVLPISSVFSTCPPVSVWGTGAVPTHRWDFLGSMGSMTSPIRLGITSQALGPSLNDPPYTLTPGQPSPGITYPPASPFGYPRKARRNRPKSASSSPTLGLARTRRYWNINQLCIDYAFRPRLSSRLTLGGLALPRNPWTSGGGVSHPSFATHACILTRCHSTTGSPAASTLHRRSATTRHKDGSTASALDLSPVTLSAQGHSTSELLRTLSRMAASKPTSWLSVQPHIVFHLVQN